MSKGQRTSSTFTLDSPRGSDTDELLRWLHQFDRQFRATLRNIATDFSQGNSALEIVDSEPTADDLDDGQRVLYDTGSELRMYTTVNDTLYYTTFTEVT